MNILSFVWLALAFATFFLHHRTIFALLIIASIFQSSAIINTGSNSLPIFYFIELVLITRFAFTSKNSTPVFNLKHRAFLQSLVIIILFWFFTYAFTHLFEGIRVYSPAYSFENNYAKKGISLVWGNNNIKQLILITLNLITLYVIYVKRREITPEYALKTIIFTTLVFSAYCLIWLLARPLANAIQILMYNSMHNANAIFESRLSGTFGEPSFAGIFIGATIVPLLVAKGLRLKLVALLMMLLLVKNGSTSGYFTLLTSLCGTFIFSPRFSLIQKALFSLSLVIASKLTFIFFLDKITDYADKKAQTISHLVRSASNYNALEIMYNTFGLGVGIGSARISSLPLSLLANFGILGTILLVGFIVSKLIRSQYNVAGNEANSMLKFMLFSAFLGSCAANPDYSYGFIWVLIFSCLLTGKTQPSLPRSAQQRTL
ncbi:hypothetical protein RGP44_000631 [Serratia marcescens]|uniref:hypothetical protein n=1 Tax=Serratia sarumanii TaxID=3020826 RepID=UPI002928C517|nr:hypothetical protein [Serratia marcescens]MBN5297873.1 hypothetical protein [Serratia marcescens]HBC0574313.1 hypothetical protein [Serratia marcescens]HBV3810740.1 hypothetical protein [Serratia marcescens]